MLAPGTTLQRYVIDAPLGTGGMGAVYRARDTHLDRAVALKVLFDAEGAMPDDEARARLVREARAAAALSHPNAVTIFDAGDSAHGPFIVMELVDGETLRNVMRRSPPLDDLVAWLKMAAQALADAHERGIVHRDVKPENLMIRHDGIAKVLDFGIARQAAMASRSDALTQAALPTLTGTGVQIGTPQYMAPEQIKGQRLDGRTDQFAWAVTAFEALTGQLPWRSDAGSLGIVASILEQEPTDVRALRAEVPPNVARVIARALSKRPEDRFGSMRELLSALEGEEASGDTSKPVRRSREGGGGPPAPVDAGATANETRFNDATLKAIIGKALEVDERGGYSKGELREVALELGISEGALEEAARAIRGEKQRVAMREVEKRETDACALRIIRRRRRRFLFHLIPYLGVNMIIMMPALMKDMGDKIWALFIPAVAWGIGLAIHALSAFSRDVEPSEIYREIDREQRAAEKLAARRAARAQGRQRRIHGDESSQHNVRGPARFDAETSATDAAALAEAEADAEEEALRARRRS